MAWWIMLPAAICSRGIYKSFMTVLHAQGPVWPWRQLMPAYLVSTISASVAFAVVTWGTTVPVPWRLPFWLISTVGFALINVVWTYGFWTNSHAEDER